MDTYFRELLLEFLIDIPITQQRKEKKKIRLGGNNVIQEQRAKQLKHRGKVKGPEIFGLAFAAAMPAFVYTYCNKLTFVYRRRWRNRYETQPQSDSHSSNELVDLHVSVGKWGTVQQENYVFQP